VNLMESLGFFSNDPGKSGTMFRLRSRFLVQ
jgi:hypothetical protein